MAGAVSLIVGNVVKDLGSNPIDISKEVLLSKLPTLLVVIGLILMIASFLLRF